MKTQPTSAQVKHLRPSDLLGGLHFLLAACVTWGALMLSLSSHLALWILGQLLVALAFLQWFVLLHEAGHRTLFKTHWLNGLAGHISSFFSLIPFLAWQRIHARHHLWTGWQDLDATTASLVPRALSNFERLAINFAWGSYFPLFALLYRLTNYWNLLRIKRYLGVARWRRIALNAALLLLLYVGILLWAGPLAIIKVCGLGIFLGLMIQDPLLLSQHTHLPQNLSMGQEVKPFTHAQQGMFTRSLRFPNWVSTLILHFDAHELHHMYVQVPGYHLRKISYRPVHEVHWWTWLREAKKLRGEVFLFQNSQQSGFIL